MARMLERVPQGFVFTAKLTHTMTHDIDPQNWRGQAPRNAKLLADQLAGLGYQAEP